MAKQTKSAIKKSGMSPHFYLWLIPLAIAVVGASLYLYYLPQRLSYTTSRTVTTASTPQSVVVGVSGHYATVHYFSGPVIFGGASGVSIEDGPTLSTHGNKVIKMALALQYSDAVVGGAKRNTEYSVKIQQPLNPGKYEVDVTATQSVGLSVRTPTPHTFITTFEIK